MARPRKLLSAQDNSHRTKEERAIMEEAEEKLYNYNPISLDEVPEGITKEGWLIYESLVPRMKQLPISDLDAGLLVIYCNTYGIYSQAVQEVSRDGYLDENGKPSGAFKVMNETSKQLKSLASSLGLSIDSRMK
ncbi:phage terminase small subunit P27 family, partial [Bacillus thuringiensis]|nr:phage terminase small subunit P27 family [Bacillus thuringiensis]